MERSCEEGNHRSNGAGKLPEEQARSPEAFHEALGMVEALASHREASGNALPVAFPEKVEERIPEDDAADRRGEEEERRENTSRERSADHENHDAGGEEREGRNRFHEREEEKDNRSIAMDGRTCDEWITETFEVEEGKKEHAREDHKVGREPMETNVRRDTPEELHGDDAREE